MNVLVLNCGSSTLKFQIIETDLDRIKSDSDITLAVGLVEKIGLEDSRLVLEVPDRPVYQDYREILEHRTAIEWVLRILVDPEIGILESVEEIGAVGHRVVHGGEAFASSVLITPEVIEQIDEPLTDAVGQRRVDREQATLRNEVEDAVGGGHHYGLRQLLQVRLEEPTEAADLRGDAGSEGGGDGR